MAEPINMNEPNPLPGRTVHEIRLEYGNMQAQILNDIFSLPAAAAQVDINMSAGELEALGLLQDEELTQVRSMIQERWAAAKREELKVRYVELDVERAAAVAERVEAVEDFLEPDGLDASAYLQAFQMDEPSLIAAFDGTVGLDSEGSEDLGKMLLKVSREREFELAVAHIVDLREDYAQAIAELWEAEMGVEDIADAADMFETYAAAAPDGPAILGSKNRFDNDLDAVARMLG